MSQTENLKEIYLAGGCFWGTEKYLSGINGIVQTDVGYANGNTKNPTYKEVCHNNTGHSETVRVFYDPTKIRLEFLLTLYYDVVNPTSVNRQGGDVGTQYRTGIYYVDDRDLETIEKSIKELQTKYEQPIAIEVLPLRNYYLAEEYHQKYLDKNPEGYCHIGKAKFEQAKLAKDEF
jgi:peptide-methionine (S)-S-oxide reductase/peptide methionine sulfoxide reductase msrA/msrB